MESFQYQNLRWNQKMSTINGVYAIVAANLILPFVSLYAIEVMDATDQQIALMDSLASLGAIIALIPGALLLNRLEQKKTFTGYSLFFGRLFLLMFAFIPWLPTEWQSWALVAIFALMGIPNATANLAWQSFIADIIPDRERSNYFSNRNRIIKLTGLGVTLASGLVLNLFAKDVAAPYQILFIVSFLFGLMEVYYLYLHRETPYAKKIEPVPTESKSLRSRWAEIKQTVSGQTAFFLFLGSSVVFHFGWQMAWPLFRIFNVRYAEATAGWLSLFEVLNGIMAFATFRWWGRLADKRGNNFAIVLSSIGISSVPFFYTISDNLYYLAVMNLYTGVFVAGITLVLFNRLLEVTTTENRSIFIAIYQIAIALSAVFAPQVGVWVLSHYTMDMALVTAGSFRFLGALTFVYVFWYLMRNHSNASETH
jgi:MFS family permease